MSKIDLARSRNRTAINEIKQLSEHPLFEYMLTKKDRDHLKQEELVVKTWQTLNEKEFNYSSPHFYKLIATISISPEEQDRISKTYDRILSALKYIKMSNESLIKN